MRIVETPAFTRRASELLSNVENDALQLMLKHSPDAGRVIVGTGGARKLRWGARGSGKSRGVRIIYYYAASEAVIYMLTVYAKSEQKTLTSAQKNAFRRIIAGLEG